jgi:Protein of unknown function (DUF3617)
MTSRLSRAVVIVLLPLAGPAGASEGIQPGLWKVTSMPEISGVAAPPQVKTRCLTPEDASDVDKTFSPAHRTQNSTCERVEHELNGTRLNWRLQCTGQMSMDVAGMFDFDTPRHYTAVVTTNSAIAGQKTNSRVTIEGEWIGECQ